MKDKKISLYFKDENPTEHYIVECLEKLCKDELSSYNAAIKRILSHHLNADTGFKNRNDFPRKKWKMNQFNIANEHISKPEEPLCPDFNGYSISTQPDQNG